MVGKQGRFGREGCIRTVNIAKSGVIPVNANDY
jgi:hypothetical protein